MRVEQAIFGLGTGEWIFLLVLFTMLLFGKQIPLLIKRIGDTIGRM